eukprot:TRINITY_DN9443_c0_g1_i2.p1 TRINITY_DN9443_c0_g1~~TRINITY_DN9443_c0_g1_i2.p1  ORF type:complete len:167 (-),score=17.97 TRINITY_DN9443_c0_g1_i2:306-806(-)
MGSGASTGRKIQPGDAGFHGVSHLRVEHNLSQHEHRQERGSNTVLKHLSKSILGRQFQHEAGSNRVPGALMASGARASPKARSIHSWLEQQDRRIIEDHLKRRESNHMDKHTGRPIHGGSSLQVQKPLRGSNLAVKKGRSVHDIREASHLQIIEDGLKKLESRVRK